MPYCSIIKFTSYHSLPPQQLSTLNFIGLNVEVGLVLIHIVFHYRLKRSFTASKRALPETDFQVPEIIHMIWIGSPLPLNDFGLGIQTFMKLNPGNF